LISFTLSGKKLERMPLTRSLRLVWYLLVVKNYLQVYPADPLIRKNHQHILNLMLASNKHSINATRLSITALNIMTFSIMALSIKRLFVKLSIKDTQHIITLYCWLYCWLSHMLSIKFYLLLCWLSLCWVSLCCMLWIHSSFLAYIYINITQYKVL